MKAGTNYTACNRYVAWLAKVNWVSVQEGEIGLTEAGIQKCARAFLSANKNPFFIIQIFCLASAYRARCLQDDEQRLLQLEPAGMHGSRKGRTVAGGQKGGSSSSMMLTVVALTAAFAVALLAARLASVMLEDVAQPARTVVGSHQSRCIVFRRQ
jgi:hypothetical protein